jgi:NAD(P)-dependent dehydrogenase (short-subunit alcohol dehydrogenase family)
MSQKTILITGCSSGIGLVCAEGLKQRGYRVLATARKPEDLKRLDARGLEALKLDYADRDSVKACAEEVAKRTNGKLFALFNNGAYGQPGATEDISRELMEDQFAANFFGLHQLTTLCLPMMRNNGGGRIVQCSSILGLMPLKFRGPYVASKFALEGLTDVMRMELKGSGIHVVTINPGPIVSKFDQNALAAFEKNIDHRNSHYAADYEKQMQRLNRQQNQKPGLLSVGNFRLGPEAVLKKLIIALEHPRPRAHYYVTLPTYVGAFARRILPSGLMDLFCIRNSG